MWPFGNRPKASLTPITRINLPLNNSFEKVELSLSPDSNKENILSTSIPSESTLAQSTDIVLEQLHELTAR